MRAILSVADKEGMEAFARGLSALGVELVSTGGTAQALEQAGIPVRAVSEVTGFPEILGGRVKTLHPAIHGGILARRDDEAHMAELRAQGIEPVDLVICNLYPFADVLARGETALEKLLEEIDIGGVTLVRAAAKNFPHVTVLVRPQDYQTVLAELEADGATRLETRRRLAALAFQHTALYDTLIAEHLRRGVPIKTFPEELTLGLRRLRGLRYGENPHQASALYAWSGMAPGLSEQSSKNGNGSTAGPATPAAIATVAGARLLQGKELSFNNRLDLDAALACVSCFTVTTTVVVKHTNPCGLACGDTLVESYRHAHAGDPVSAYGGILGFNREVDEATAVDISQIFYEAIIAPSYSDEALAILSQKKNLRLLATDTPIGPSAGAVDAHDPYRL
ncbi:MAG: bifunctional phosphoribosylaminoimidazolecarboxamide formyltransferase/IMP cyclohydrolase, partial [Ktedonobacterales bacterium]|nr:bifunctional phosphoribosylaminoimidazolecarboxamide formyltransferase/IMP cyclohydrolase [Ktedonobacterales bacterium]